MSRNRWMVVLIAPVVVVYLVTSLILKAPLQYDPWGPGGWPRLLAWLLALVLVAIFLFDKGPPVVWSRKTWAGIAPAGKGIGLLLLYVVLFEPLGFIVSTFVMSAAFARIHHARWGMTMAVALTLSVGGYLLCAVLLGLNLPMGALFEWIGGRHA